MTDQHVRDWAAESLSPHSIGGRSRGRSVRIPTLGNDLGEPRQNVVRMNVGSDRRFFHVLEQMDVREGMPRQPVASDVMRITKSPPGS
jgi:hypothetical protein